MHVSPAQQGRRLRLTIPPEQIAEVVAQLRAIAQIAEDPIAATRVRRLLMQLRGQEDTVELHASAADFVLLLDWGLSGARAELDAVLDDDAPDMLAAEGAFERVRWYLGALAEIAALEADEPEDEERPVEPMAARRGRWRHASDAEAAPLEPVAHPA